MKVNVARAIRLKRVLLLEMHVRLSDCLLPFPKHAYYYKRIMNGNVALPSLSYRRKSGDMIEVYKYTHGQYKVSALPVEVEGKTTRGHTYR